MRNVRRKVKQISLGGLFALAFISAMEYCIRRNVEVSISQLSPIYGQEVKIKDHYRVINDDKETQDQSQKKDMPFEEDVKLMTEEERSLERNEMPIWNLEKPAKDDEKIIKVNEETNKRRKQSKQKETERHIQFPGFQKLNDNLTYVYIGYYDDREKEPEVKVIAMIPRQLQYNFTGTISYPDQSKIEVTCTVLYHYARAVAFTVKHEFRNGYVICPVAREKGRPIFLLLGKQGTIPSIHVSVSPPSKVQNKVTRCIKPFIKNYNDVLQLISNVELFRIFGVDKHIFYLEDQTQIMKNLLQAYVNEGLAEIRNFSILQPGTPIGNFIKREVHWSQWSAYHDCILSQMYSTKYVMVWDVDEVLVPRKHKTIWEMADEQFKQSENDPQPAGALMFRNVYFPTFKNKTRQYFPRKDLAMKYNIHPLLYTTRTKTSEPYIGPKSLVRPKTVDVLFIHYVETFKKGWRNKIVEEKVATMNHYRGSSTPYMLHPETQDNYILQFSEQLIEAVTGRFEEVFGHNLTNFLP